MRTGTERHMGVAEVKRRFADVIGEVMHTKRRIIIERRGRPVAVLGPIDQQAESRTPGQRLAAAFGCGGEEGAAFDDFLLQVVAARRERMPRPVPEDEQ